MSEVPNPHLERYLKLHQMADDETRPKERRELLKSTALDMVLNQTKIEGVTFMPKEEHVVFMAALINHAEKVSQEVREMEVSK